jgi:hypothetical protein
VVSPPRACSKQVASVRWTRPPWTVRDMNADSCSGRHLGCSEPDSTSITIGHILLCAYCEITDFSPFYCTKVHFQVTIFASPNAIVVWLILLLRIREVPFSNFGPDTGFSDWGFSSFPYVPRGKNLDITSVQATAATFRILSSSLLIHHPYIWRYFSYWKVP